MTNRFMVSVAALALIAGTGFANAQGMSKESGGGLVVSEDSVLEPLPLLFTLMGLVTAGLSPLLETRRV